MTNLAFSPTPKKQQKHGHQGKWIDLGQNQAAPPRANTAIANS
jgi:hypothetical protein